MNQTADAPPDVKTDAATIDRHVWATLKNSLFPGAADDSIRMVLSYCKARGLDPMKKPCHIVPMYVRNADGTSTWRDVVFPGIYELRTTAMKTGLYMGQDKAVFGEDFDFLGQKVPVSCEITVQRWHEKSKEKVNYSATVWFAECAGTKKPDNEPERLNARWNKAPRQMIEKCAEAAALRKAFPDELGGEMSAEEMHGASIVDSPLAIGKPSTAAPQSQSDAAAAESAPIADEQSDSQADAATKHCSKAQANLVTKRLDESGIPEKDFLRRFEIDHLDFLPFSRVDEALNWIKELVEPPA